MRLIKHYSLLVADKVLKEMRPLLKNHIGSDMTVSCLANGREQGLKVVNHHAPHSPCVGICQHRNSDHIRIWYGPSHTFDFNGIPSDVTLDRCFPYEDVKEAAAFCAFLLLTGIGEEK